jgi:hypothetical protein
LFKRSISSHLSLFNPIHNNIIVEPPKICSSVTIEIDFTPDHLLEDTARSVGRNVNRVVHAECRLLTTLPVRHAFFRFYCANDAAALPQSR